MRLLDDCSRRSPHADRGNMENYIVRLEVVVDSVYRLVDSFDRGAQGNAERILPLSWIAGEDFPCHSI